MPNQYSTLTDAVDRFAVAMKKKLHEKAQDGWSGWDCDDFVDSGACVRKLHEHTFRMLRGEESEVVDVANFCMFIFDREQRKAAVAQKVNKAQEESSHE